MAVENKYVDLNLIAGKLADAAMVHGSEVRKIVSVFEIAAADSDTSVYRVAKGLSPDIIITNITVANDAITGGTDFDIGIYGVLSFDGIGAVISGKGDCFLNGGDLSSAHVRGSELSGISALDVANSAKRLYEVAGHTQLTKKQAYDIGLLGNTVGSGAGTVVVTIEFVL